MVEKIVFDAASGIIGMMDVIKSDFEASIESTNKQNKQRNKKQTNKQTNKQTIIPKHFKSLQNRSESLPDGFEWIRMDPNDFWQLKNPETTSENGRKTRRNASNKSRTNHRKHCFFC